MYEISNIYWNKIFGYLSHLRDMFCLLFVGIIRHSNPNFLLSSNDHDNNHHNSDQNEDDDQAILR